MKTCLISTLQDEVKTKLEIQQKIAFEARADKDKMMSQIHELENMVNSILCVCAHVFVCAQSTYILLQSYKFVPVRMYCN